MMNHKKFVDIKSKLRQRDASKSYKLMQNLNKTPSCGEAQEGGTIFIHELCRTGDYR